MKIGIGITTRNRYEVFKKSYEANVSLRPKGAKTVVVDDASDTPVPEATYRFDTNVGIARAKNKCLELLEDCNHIFLFDDDTYPLVESWWQPYIESPEPHLMYCFDKYANGRPVGDDRVVYDDGATVAHQAARGCMLYIDRRVLDVVGGFDTNYGLAMHEHLDFSNRIYNVGLTTFRVMDIPNSNQLVYSADEHQGVSSAIDATVRRANLQTNQDYYNRKKNSAKYCNYKDTDEYPSHGYGVAIASYFTCGTDAQRGGKVWKVDYSATKTLRESVDGKASLVLLNDCFTEPDYGTVQHHKTPSSGNPYFMRWIAAWRYLRDHPDIGWVWLVDSTDTELLKVPDVVPGAIYTGDEPATVGTPWMLTMAKSPQLKNWIRQNHSKPLLNCGVLGGSRKDIMDICRKLYDAYIEGGCVELVEMPLYNYILYRDYAPRLKYGRDVTTVFKQFETNSDAIWRHK